MVDKHDLRGSIEKMREVAQLLALWAADMERSLGVPGNHPRISLPRSRRPASGPVPEQAPVKIPEPAVKDVSPAPDPVPAVTFDQVRSVLAAKCAAGYRTQVQALINSYGATRFSEVDPSRYAELVEAAGMLGEPLSTAGGGNLERGKVSRNERAVRGTVATIEDAVGDPDAG